MAKENIVDAEDRGWQVHQALGDWTGRIDGKASIALALESAGLGIALTALGEEGWLGGATGVAVTLAVLAAGAFILAAAFSVAVVFPQLSVRKVPNGRPGRIYFGHLRDWSPDALALSLESDPLDEDLGRQLVVMSRVLWRKHRWLQVSLVAFFVGALLLATATLVEFI
jgi:hypothetical protein